MNTDQNAALMNRLILLVLSLILVCLVLLVVRGYVKPGRASSPAPAAAEIAAAPEEPAPAAEPVEPLPTRPLARPSTNVVRAAPVISRLTPPPPPLPDAGDSEPWIVRDSTIGFGGVSSSPGVGVGGGAVTATNDGEIFGIVTLLGTPKPEVAINLGPSCGRLNRQPVTTRHYVVNSERQLANVLVFIADVRAGEKVFPSAAPVLLDQVGCMFQPYTLALLPGQPLQVRNSDPELHNIHFTPRSNREINVAQPLKWQVNTFSFYNPELFMRLKCDVHPWMFAYVSVVERPWFAITGTNGSFRLPGGLPAGRYTLAAAHLKSGSLSQQIDFRPGEPKAIEFQFTIPDATQAQSTVTRPAR